MKVFQTCWSTAPNRPAVFAGPKRFLTFVLHAVVLLLLLILLMVTGIKCTWSKHKARSFACLQTGLFSLFCCSTNTFSLFPSLPAEQRGQRYPSSPGDDESRREDSSIHLRWGHASGSGWLSRIPVVYTSVYHLCSFGLSLNSTCKHKPSVWPFQTDGAPEINYVYLEKLNPVRGKYKISY